MNKSIFNTLIWVFSRVGIIYLIFILFLFTCVDLKKLDLRIKIRHVNAAMPNFSSLIAFAKHKKNTTVDWKKYKNYFEMILQNNFDDVMTKNMLGYTYYFMGNEEKAQRMFEDSFFTGYQNCFWASYNLGVLNYKKGLYQQASNYLKKTININLVGSVEVMKSSIVYHQIFASPEFTYNIDEEILDALSSAYILMAATMINLGQFEQAVKVCSLAMQNSQIRRKEAFFYYAGVAFFKLGVFDKAILFFQKHLEIEKNNPLVYSYMSQIYESVGRKEDSVKLFKIFQVLNNSNQKMAPYDQEIELRFF